MLTKIVKPGNEKHFERVVSLGAAIAAIVATFLVEYFHYIVR